MQNIDFKEVTLDMKPLVDSYFKNCGYIGCEYTFSNLFIWRKNYKTCIAQYEGFLLVKHIINEHCYYLMPVGKGNVKAPLEALIAFSAENDCKFTLSGVTAEGRARIEADAPGLLNFRATRDWFDYIYDSNDLIELTGGKYHSKRNHINKFELLNGTDTYEDISDKNIGECMEIYLKWVKEHETDNDLSAEYSAVTEALNNFTALGLKGGLTRADGSVCAFTVGAEINRDVFVIHIEKGLNECPGVYAVINRDFAMRNLSGYKYINREEDMGIEGLRKAKLSYKPAILLEKFIATEKGAHGNKA